MNRYGFKWCWPTTRCGLYAAHAAVLQAVKEGAQGRDVMPRVRELYELGSDMMEHAPFRCVLCWARAEPNNRDDRVRRLTLDHLVPMSSRRRRAHGVRNLLSVCASCNSSRQAGPLRPWLRAKHEAGEIETPDVVLHRVEVARRAPLCRTVATEVLRVYYPTFVSRLPGRWSRYVERRRAHATALADIPF